MPDLFGQSLGILSSNIGAAPRGYFGAALGDSVGQIGQLRQVFEEQQRAREKEEQKKQLAAQLQASRAAAAEKIFSVGDQQLTSMAELALSSGDDNALMSLVSLAQDPQMGQLRELGYSPTPAGEKMLSHNLGLQSYREKSDIDVGEEEGKLGKRYDNFMKEMEEKRNKAEEDEGRRRETKTLENQQFLDRLRGELGQRESFAERKEGRAGKTKDAAADKKRREAYSKTGGTRIDERAREYGFTGSGQDFAIPTSVKEDSGDVSATLATLPGPMQEEAKKIVAAARAKNMPEDQILIDLQLLVAALSQ